MLQGPVQRFGALLRLTGAESELQMVGRGLQLGLETEMSQRCVAAGTCPRMKPLSQQVQLLQSAVLVGADHRLLPGGVANDSGLLM